MNDLEFVGDYRQPHLSARQRALGHDGTSAGEFSFGDFIDIINPLQHIPVVSTLYREITGDEISAPARILGDTLFGGPMGFVSSIANVFYEEVAGEDPGETLLAFFTGEETEGEPQFAGDDGEVVPAAGAALALLAPLETAAGPAAAANAEAILPEAAPGMLTGQDALNALFLDLGGSRPSAAAAAPPPAPSAAAAAEANPLLFAQEAGEAAIADRMMQALDKYRAMSQQSRRGDDRADPEDQSKRVHWQSDPAAADGT